MLSWLANLGNELITDGRQFLIFTSLKLFGLIECPIKPIKIIYLLINGSFQRCYSHLWFSQQRGELGNLSSLRPLQLRYLGVSSRQEQSYCVQRFNPFYSLFQLCLRMWPEHLVSVLLLPVFCGQVLQGGFEDILIGFEPGDNLFCPLVLSMKVGESSLDSLKILKDLASFV